MKKYYIFLAVLLLFGCISTIIYKDNFKTHEPINFEFREDKLIIDDKIKPIYYEWLEECLSHKLKPDFNNVNFICFSDTLSDNYAGLQINNEGIYINKKHIESPYLKIIVYHELAHGMFYIQHDTTNLTIMSPYFTDFIAKIYLTNWDKYKQEYWENIKNKS
jgi:hypothetical protein